MTEQELEITRLKRRLKVAEKILENLTVDDLYEHSMWTRTAGEALLREFWASGVGLNPFLIRASVQRQRRTQNLS